MKKHICVLLLTLSLLALAACGGGGNGTKSEKAIKEEVTAAILAELADPAEVTSFTIEDRRTDSGEGEDTMEAHITVVGEYMEGEMNPTIRYHKYDQGWRLENETFSLGSWALTKGPGEADTKDPLLEILATRDRQHTFDVSFEESQSSDDKKDRGIATYAVVTHHAYADITNTYTIELQYDPYVGWKSDRASANQINGSETLTWRLEGTYSNVPHFKFGYNGDLLVHYPTGVPTDKNNAVTEPSFASVELTIHSFDGQTVTFDVSAEETVGNRVSHTNSTASVCFINKIEMLYPQNRTEPCLVFDLGAPWNPEEYEEDYAKNHGLNPWGGLENFNRYVTVVPDDMILFFPKRPVDFSEYEGERLHSIGLLSWFARQ